MNKRTNECEMIPGNIAPDVMTFKKDLHCYHLQVETRLIDPRTPLYPIIKTRILVLRPMDYQTYFNGSAESNTGYMKVMNFATARLVWDPCAKGAKELNDKVIAEQKAAREAFCVTPEHKAKESKRRATIGDIERLTKKDEF